MVVNHPETMARLQDLPTESFILILEWIARIDIQSLIISQLTSKQFHSVVRDVLLSIQNGDQRHESCPEEKSVIHPLWKFKFRGLFNLADCFTEGDRARLIYLTLDGDYMLPFRRLPWAQDEVRRAAYLRPEASWRPLSLTFGHAPVTHLDVVKTYSSSDGSRDTVDYYQVGLPSSGLSMGLFYDLLLSEGVTYGCNTGGWELLLGKRLRSYDVLLEYECFIADDSELVEFGGVAQQAAILYVRGGSTYEDNLDQGTWIPRRIGKARPKLFPWQGPKPYFVF